VQKSLAAVRRPDGQLPDALALQHAKECVLAAMETPLAQGLALETKAIQVLFSSQDQKEGMAAFIEKRKPAFKGR